MAISPSPFDRIQKHRRAPRRVGLLWVLVCVALIACAVYFRQPASSLLWRIVAPVVRLREAWGSSQAVQLRAQLASTTAALSDRNALYAQNMELKERLGRADPAVPRIVAGVLQRPPWTAYDTLVIDAGQAQGIVVGALVSAGGQDMIGRISEVYATSARVELFSAPGATYQATLNGTLPIAVEGQGGGSMRAQVPAGTQVKVGDTIQFPGLAGGIVAFVSATDTKEGESFIVVYLHLPVNPADLRFVDVLKP